jgi:hypothetical protein
MAMASKVTFRRPLFVSTFPVYMVQVAGLAIQISRYYRILYSARDFLNNANRSGQRSCARLYVSSTKFCVTSFFFKFRVRAIVRALVAPCFFPPLGWYFNVDSQKFGKKI